MWRRSLMTLGAVALLSSGAGCGSQACDTGETTPVVYTDGVVNKEHIYYSSSAHHGLLHFPGGQRYDLVHHLGFEPIDVHGYWSFSEDGVGIDASTGTITPATGNSFEIELKNDQFIRIKNDSCAEFWVLVTASGDPGAGQTDLDGGAE